MAWPAPLLCPPLPPRCLTCAPSLAPPPPVARLLGQRAACVNWDAWATAAGATGWDVSIPPVSGPPDKARAAGTCRTGAAVRLRQRLDAKTSASPALLPRQCQWTGVGCSASGSIEVVDLSCDGQGPLDEMQLAHDQAYEYCAPGVRLTCTVAPELAGAQGAPSVLPASAVFCYCSSPARLPHCNAAAPPCAAPAGISSLRMLNFGGANMSGTLHAAWGDSGLPSLEILYGCGGEARRAAGACCSCRSCPYLSCRSALTAAPRPATLAAGCGAAKSAARCPRSGPMRARSRACGASTLAATGCRARCRRRGARAAPSPACKSCGST